MHKFAIGLIVFYILILVGGCIGWVMNIVKLTQLDFQAPYKAEIVRVVGVVPFVGAITGYINVDDSAKLDTPQA